MTSDPTDYLNDPAWGIDAHLEIANDDLLPLAGIVRIIHRFKLLDDPATVPDALVYRLLWAFHPSSRAGYQLPVGVDSPDQLSPAERRQVLKNMWETLGEQVEETYRQHHRTARGDASPE